MLLKLNNMPIDRKFYVDFKNAIKTVQKVYSF